LVIYIISPTGYLATLSPYKISNIWTIQ